MKVKDQEYWEKRLEKLSTENRSIRETLISLKGEQRNLKKSLKNIKTLFDAVPVAIVLVQDGKMVEINRTALQQLGYNEEECVGRDFLDFVSPESRPFMERIHKARLSGKWVPTQYEVELLNQRGEPFGCDVRIRKFRYRGRRAFLAVLTGHEGRKKREKEVIQAEKMEALMTMASGLNRKISDGIRAINDHIGRLRDMGGSEGGVTMTSLDQIEAAAGLIFKTSRELDSLSRRKHNPSKVTVFDLKKIVKQVMASIGVRIKEAAETRGVKLNIRSYLRTVSPIEGDPEEIQDVIVNTILNAVDAMPKGGDIYLSTEENGGNAYIYIQDNGIGIAEPVNGRILDPYFTTKGGDGMGLGLSLSYAIVQRHHGEIEVTSKKGVGTTVTIRLPLAKVEPERKKEPLRKRIKNASILVISREHIVGELLAQVLRSKGYRIQRTSSGLEGLNQLKRRRFDLVIADLENSDTGKDVLVEKIALRVPEIPLVLIQSKGKRRKIGPSRLPSVSLVLNKPINMDKMANQISEVLLRKAEQPSEGTET